MPSCANPACTNDSHLTCSNCKAASYCSASCQKTHWATHKPTCIKPIPWGSISEKSNSFLIRATGRMPSVSSHTASSSSEDTNDNLADYIAPFGFVALGNEPAECKELTVRLRWPKTWPFDTEIKFYSSKPGEDRWHYFCYGPEQDDVKQRSLAAKSDELPKGPLFNAIASRLTGAREGSWDVYGDIAVVRNYPSGSAGIEEEFTGTELMETLRWYLGGADVKKTFVERERSRAMRRMMPGMNFQGV